MTLYGNKNMPEKCKQHLKTFPLEFDDIVHYETGNDSRYDKDYYIVYFTYRGEKREIGKRDVYVRCIWYADDGMYIPDKIRFISGQCKNYSGSEKVSSSIFYRFCFFGPVVEKDVPL